MRRSTVSAGAGGFRGGLFLILILGAGALPACRDNLAPPRPQEADAAPPPPREVDAATAAADARAPSIDPPVVPPADAAQPDAPDTGLDAAAGAPPPDAAVPPRDAAAPDRAPEPLPPPADGPPPPPAPPPTPPPLPPPSCGLPNGPCCADGSCASGGCCGLTVNGQRRCVAPGMNCRLQGGDLAGTCQAGLCSGCGSVLNQRCCQGLTCLGPGLVCGGQFCQPCGTANGTCCPGNICNAGLACVGDACEACGGPGQPCCANRSCNNGGCCLGAGLGQCTGAAQACLQPGPNGGQCMAGRCSLCGNAGQGCCTGDVCWGTDQACVDDECVACGKVNQPACRGRSCDPDLCVDGNGTCVAVGALCGQASGRCMPGGSCVAGNQACGGMNLPCCGGTAPPVGVFCSRPGTVCQGLGVARRCVSCGEVGQSCCDGDLCRTGACSGLIGNRTCR